MAMPGLIIHFPDFHGNDLRMKFLNVYHYWKRTKNSGKFLLVQQDTLKEEMRLTLNLSLKKAASYQLRYNSGKKLKVTSNKKSEG